MCGYSQIITHLEFVHSKVLIQIRVDLISHLHISMHFWNAKSVLCAKSVLLANCKLLVIYKILSPDRLCTWPTRVQYVEWISNQNHLRIVRILIINHYA